VQTINKHLNHKELRDGFTVGGSLLLAAIGRIRHPPSKRNWYQRYAGHTSLSYLLRMSLNKLDGNNVDCYRVRTEIWQLDLTVVVYISEKLRQGQIRGTEQSIKKLFSKLNELKKKIKVPKQRGKKGQKRA